MSAETQDIPMPRIGEDEDEYAIVAWLKRPGDEIAAGEVIAEAMTEKANVEVESPVAGALEEILVEEDTVAVGQPIAWVIESEG
jgi:pyruvate/2-oxoglutarate dehydrogenase complex dihydrolipoamide acyltransferase (E2) component